MEHYAGIDVSLELSSVCIVDAKGKIVRETKVTERSRMRSSRFSGTLAFRWRGSGSKPDRCRSGFMPG